LQHTQQEPDLQPVPARDRAVLAKALAKNPENRFPSCLDFVRALKAEGAPRDAMSDSDLLLATSSGETILNRLAETPKPLAVLQKPILPDNVLTGYRYLERLANSPLAEIWKVQAP